MRILIVEDSLTQAVDLRRRLEGLGHEVVVAHDGREAWERLEKRPEGLVISDWMMPEMSGLELCRKIRSEIKSPYVYLILLTAKTHRHERLQGLQAGADDFLGKPIDNVELDVALRSARRILDAQEALEARARELERANQALASQATTDEPSGLKNAIGFRHSLVAAFRQALDDGLPLSLIEIELIPSGAPESTPSADWNTLARRCGEILRSEARSCDEPGRLGERRFGLIVPGLADDEALMVGDALRSRFEDEVATLVSSATYAGVASMSSGEPPESAESLTAACEVALLSARREAASRIALVHCSSSVQAASLVGP
ncbi:GGDEF domain-containing response regulator [Aquisphaera insulae]|uniref:GGDEF domain-containing response regulator n=1 Tax=Aquisphaera insulae TaxID=2712864 RepID=UPI0013EBA7E2|nr:response regulator [Aquisphaera insulae]